MTIIDPASGLPIQPAGTGYSIPAATAAPVAVPASPSIVPAIVGASIATAEVLVPGLAPFDPLIALVMTAVRAHFQAASSMPTDQQVIAALPVDYQTLVTMWANWKPQGS
jgi:hypothetical protein